MDPKQQVLETSRDQLGRLEAEIQALMAEATSADYDDYLTDIRAKQEQARAALAELEEAGEGDWQQLEPCLNKVLADVKNALFVLTSDPELVTVTYQKPARRERCHSM